jgi:hypothetical protein
MHPVAARGRRMWGLAGLAVAASLAVPGGWLIASAGVGGGPRPRQTDTRQFTVARPVTTLDVQSQGAPVRVTAGPVRRVRVTESITFNPQDGRMPVVPQFVSDGILTLIEPQCDCTVGFTVTVPPGLGVAADTGGGPLTVSGVAAANLDSGGGPVSATGISGPLVVTTDSGTLTLDGLTGPLQASTGGGALLARGIDAGTAAITTGGGAARIEFSEAPDGVFVSTGGGLAALTLPGGPYALTARSYGGHEAVGIATDPAAGRSVTVITGGGPLMIEPPTGRVP